MAKSFKNYLQEYCMKNKFSLPRYYSEYTKKDTEIFWKSRVEVCDSVFYNKLEQTRKVNAEEEVAGIAYNFLINEAEKKIEYSQIKPEIIVLVDYENMQPEFVFNKPLEYHLFLSCFSSVNTSKFQNNPNVNIHLIESGNSDSSDHLMTYETGKMIITRPEIQYYFIISRDKFSSILKTMLENDGKKVKHFKDMLSFKNFLETF